MKSLSRKARNALRLIGHGVYLRVPHDDREPATIVQGKTVPATDECRCALPGGENCCLRHQPERLILDAATRDEILNSGLVGLLTKRRHMSKIGWEEAGLDGTQAEYWGLIQ